MLFVRSQTPYCFLFQNKAPPNPQYVTHQQECYLVYWSWYLLNKWEHHSPYSLFSLVM